MQRRQFLKAAGASLAAGVLSRCAPQQVGCTLEPDDERPPAPAPDWLRDARIAGFESFVGQSPCNLATALDQLAEEHVNVVEIDPGLSFYLTEAEFEDHVELTDAVARGCHLRGMRALAYYPTLEVLTSDAETRTHTMFKDHPEWLQIGLDGAPNVFVGGEGRVFWVEPGQESAWMCPTSGYRDYFVNRVVALTQTALDGVWGDVPLFSDIGGYWPCTNDTCNQKFRADTGLAAPTAVDWDDPAFRRWVQWRHTVMWEFEQAIARRAKEARPDFETIIETVTMDYSAATAQGLDGASHEDGPVHRVWEIDAVSDNTAMRDASANDWMAIASMMQFGRGASGARPSWVFCYGLEEDDAEHVMALAIASGNNPYETRIPVMNSSVGSDYRRRMFAWLERHPNVYRGASAHATAVLYSSASRDLLDRNSATGLYTETESGDPLWWSTSAEESARSLPYVGDFRGTCKALIHAHVPYDSLTVPHVGPSALARYRLVAVPSAAALSTETMSHLTTFVIDGGTLLLTGPDIGIFEESGVTRDASPLLDTFGLDPAVVGWTEATLGSGRILYNRERTGQAYLAHAEPQLLGDYRRAVDAAGAPQVVVHGAAPSVFFSLRRDDQVLQLFCVNLQGLGRNGAIRFAPEDVHLDVSVHVGERTPRQVIVSQPDAGAADRPIEFTIESQRVRFGLTVRALAMVLID